MKTIEKSLFFSAIIAVAMVSQANAGDPSSAPNAFLPALITATAPELPAKSADLVSQATVKQRQATTIAVVQAAVGLNPAAASAIVGAIAKAVPEMAATAAATAASLVPTQVATIAGTAAAAAPSQAGQIVVAVCRVIPQAYKEVAEAVARAVPGSDKKILTALVAAIPSLQGPINQIVATSKGSPISQLPPGYDTPLPTIEPMGTSLPIPMDGGGVIGIGTPYETYSGTPQGVASGGTGGTVPVGGRSYSSP